MKVFILLGAITFFLGRELKAQTEFAPIGAEWCYGSTGWNKVHYARYIVTKDTVINGQNCRKVEGVFTAPGGSDGSDDPGFAYTALQFFYTSSDTVFYYNDSFAQFFPLYIFNVNVGDTVTYRTPIIQEDNPNLKDTFFKVVVDKVDTLTIDGEDLRRIWIYPLNNFTFQPNNYIERIGSTFYMGGHTFPNMIPENAERSLRAYKDDLINYQYTDYSCDHLPTGIERVKYTGKITVYPNPSTGMINISSAMAFSATTKISIIDISGRIVMERLLPIGAHETTCNLSHLTRGLYFIQLKNEELYSCQKISLMQ